MSAPVLTWEKIDPAAVNTGPTVWRCSVTGGWLICLHPWDVSDRHNVWNGGLAFMVDATHSWLAS